MLQLCSQVSNNTPLSARGALRALLDAFAALQLRGLSPVPPLCTSLSPMVPPVLVMSSALALFALWLAKLLRHRPIVKSEFEHPVQGAMLALLPVSIFQDTLRQTLRLRKH
jgi:hypothetical protein